jgi:hypothetical protein
MINENKFEISSLDIEIELVALRSYCPNFSNTVDKIIEDHLKYPYYSQRYNLSSNDLSILEELKLAYSEENKEFTLINCQKEFQEYLGKAVNSFTSKTEALKESSIFDLYDYEPENLVRNFNINRLEEINDLIKEKKVIHKLFLDRYKKDLNELNDLNYTNLSGYFRKNPTEIINNLNKYAFMFEECHAFSPLEYSFSYYPQASDGLRELILEMKKQDLIPPHIEKIILEGDQEFHNFYRLIVEKHNLHTELIEELPLNIPIKKKKLLKV